MILANVRARLRGADCRLVVVALARLDPGGRARVERRLAAEGPDVLLDEPGLLDALLAIRSLAVPSAALFAYVAVRHALLAAGLNDRPLADYLAALLARFARTDQLYAMRDATGRPLESVVELLVEAERAWAFEAADFNPFRERTIRQHIGDYTLFMTGIFREHVERCASMGFYVRAGKRAYQAVADFERSALRPDARVFAALSSEFEDYAGALSYMKRVYLRPADSPPSVQPLLRMLTEW